MICAECKHFHWWSNLKMWVKLPKCGFLDKGNSCLVKRSFRTPPSWCPGKPIFPGKSSWSSSVFPTDAPPKRRRGGKATKQLFCCFAFPRGLTGSGECARQWRRSGKAQFRRHWVKWSPPGGKWETQWETARRRSTPDGNNKAGWNNVMLLGRKHFSKIVFDWEIIRIFSEYESETLKNQIMQGIESKIFAGELKRN